MGDRTLRDRGSVDSARLLTKGDRPVAPTETRGRVSASHRIGEDRLRPWGDGRKIFRPYAQRDLSFGRLSPFGGATHASPLRRGRDAPFVSNTRDGKSLDPTRRRGRRLSRTLGEEWLGFPRSGRAPGRQRAAGHLPPCAGPFSRPPCVEPVFLSSETPVSKRSGFDGKETKGHERVRRLREEAGETPAFPGTAPPPADQPAPIRGNGERTDQAVLSLRNSYPTGIPSPQPRNLGEDADGL